MRTVTSTLLFSVLFGMCFRLYSGNAQHAVSENAYILELVFRIGIFNRNVSRAREFYIIEKLQLIFSI